MIKKMQFSNPAGRATPDLGRVGPVRKFSGGVASLPALEPIRDQVVVKGGRKPVVAKKGR